MLGLMVFMLIILLIFRDDNLGNNIIVRGDINEIPLNDNGPIVLNNMRYIRVVNDHIIH